MNNLPDNVFDKIVGYLVKGCRRRIRPPFKRPYWQYWKHLDPELVRLAPLATVSKRFQSQIERYTFCELYLEVDEFGFADLWTGLDDTLTPERVAHLRVLECLVPLANRIVGNPYVRSLRLRDSIVALFKFLNRHKDIAAEATENPRDVFIPEHKRPNNPWESFFISDDSDDWVLPDLPEIGSFTLSTSTYQDDNTVSELRFRLIESILLSAQFTQELVIGYPAAYTDRHEGSIAGTKSVLMAEEICDLLEAAPLNHVPAWIKRLQVRCVRCWVPPSDKDLNIMENFVREELGRRESLNIQLTGIPGLALFRERALTQLRHLTLENVMIPGFNDFMIALSKSMVTMFRLETLLIRFKKGHGPYQVGGRYFVAYNKPSVLGRWKVLHDAYRHGVYGAVEPKRQGLGNMQWAVPPEVLRN
ncbi:hypothetical protein QBC39DRAFT_409023, partial [Podospora conica]